MEYIVAFGIELLVGLVIGFYLTDRKRGLSFHELRIGVVLLLLFSAFMMWKHGAIQPITWIHTGISFVSLFAGILLGEYLHFKMVYAVTQKIRKEDVHESVHAFIQEAGKFAETKEMAAKTSMFITMSIAVDKLEKVYHHAIMMNKKDTAAELREIMDTCRTISRVSANVCEDKICDFHELSERLDHVTWNALQTTEACVKKKMSQPVRAMAFALKSIHIK